MTDAPGEGAWPIAATNFILIYKQPKDAARTKSVLDFFRWAYANGREQADALHYVPLPDALVKQVEAYWTANIK
jgi:phosphate transport system substrate-binding protein